MPKYRCKEKSLIGNELHEAGDIVEYDGLPAENLEPLDAEGEAKYQEYLASNAARVKAMQTQFSESAVGDPRAFAAELAKANAEMMAAMPGMIAAAVAQAIATAVIQAQSPAPAAAKVKGKADDPLV